MGEVDVSDEFDKSSLFSFLKFHGAGVSQQVTKAMIQNGAEECRFMSDDVTHIIIGTHMHKDPNVVGLSELYSQAVLVDESWAISSIMLQKILSPRLFAPKAMAFFEGLIVSFSGISTEDRRKLWFVMSHFGALCLIVLDSRCNLLIAGQPQGLKYNKALKMPSKISIVSPDWVTACLTTGEFVSTESYHPKHTILSEEYEDAMVKQEMKPPEEPPPPNLTIGICAPLKDPSILQFSTDNTKNRLSIRKNNSKFVKANIQFFHSGHGAPPALADREKRKEKAMNMCPKTNPVPKSPVASSVESVPIKSEPSPAVKDMHKPKRIIRLTRKRPLHFQHEPKPEKRLYNFLQLNETIDNRVPKECCARGCRFLVNDVKKFISSDLSSALKEFLSGKNFDCSCPCHFFSTSLINEINCQGAWLDAESNPRIRALLDLQRLVSSVPRNYQTEFLQSTFYSPTESVLNPNPNLSQESTERCVSSMSEKYNSSKSAEESSGRKSVQEEYLTTNHKSSTPRVTPDVPLDLESSAGTLNVIVTLHGDGTASSKSASKVNPALNALYSKYTSEIVQMDEKRILMKFRRVKCKSENEESAIKEELEGSNYENLDCSKMKDLTQIRTPGTTVDVYWDEKQLKGTEFNPGWYTSIVSSYKVETDQIIIQDLFTPSKTYKIPVTQLLAEDKLRLSKSFLPSTAVVPEATTCPNSSVPPVNAPSTPLVNGLSEQLTTEGMESGAPSKLHVDCSLPTANLKPEPCGGSSFMCSDSNNGGQISPAAFVNLPSDVPRTKKYPSQSNTTNNCQSSQQQQQPIDIVNLPSPGNIFNNFDLEANSNSAMLSSIHNQSSSSVHLSDNDTNQVLHRSSSSLSSYDESSLNLKSALRTNEDPPMSKVVDSLLFTDQQQHATPSVCSDYFSEGGLDEICMTSAVTSLPQPHQTSSKYVSNSNSSLLSSTFNSSLLFHDQQSTAFVGQSNLSTIDHSSSSSANIATNSRSQVQYYQSSANQKSRRDELKKSVEFDDLSSDEEVEKSNDESGVENDQEFITKNALNILDNLKMF